MQSRPGGASSGGGAGQTRPSRPGPLVSRHLVAPPPRQAAARARRDISRGSFRERGRRQARRREDLVTAASGRGRCGNGSSITHTPMEGRTALHRCDTSTRGPRRHLSSRSPELPVDHLHRQAAEAAPTQRSPRHHARGRRQRRRALGGHRPTGGRPPPPPPAAATPCPPCGARLGAGPVAPGGGVPCAARPTMAAVLYIATTAARTPPRLPCPTVATTTSAAARPRPWLHWASRWAVGGAAAGTTAPSVTPTAEQSGAQQSAALARLQPSAPPLNGGSVACGGVVALAGGANLDRGRRSGGRNRGGRTAGTARSPHSPSRLCS